MDFILELVRTGHISEALMSLVLILSFIVEKLPGKIKPWTAALRWIGHIMNADLARRLDGIDETAKDNKGSIDALKRAIQEHEAMTFRGNIQNFADNLRLGLPRSDTQYELVILEIGRYERYCDEHNIPNHVIDEAKEYIFQKYREQKNM